MPANHNGRIPIPIVFEDQLCVVFNKPAGLLVVPAESAKNITTLTDIVNKQYVVNRLSEQFRLHPCHRLDRDTSGAILYAKGKKNQKILMELFQQKKIFKQYTAFVHGALSQKVGEIRSEIKDYYQNKFAASSRGKAAITKYKTLQVYKQFSVVDVMPVTGRTNQIRIHFAHIKHPLVGEDRYAFRKDFVLKFKRTALHARELEWVHPVGGHKLRVKVPLADDMQRFLEVYSLGQN